MNQNLEQIRKDLASYGIENVKDIYYNLSYDELYEHETKAGLTGFDRAYLTDMGAVSVDTGEFTGRSPKDKYIVKEASSEKNVWWAQAGRKGSDNKAISPELWEKLYKKGSQQLSAKNLYVQDGYVGANPNSRICIRVVTEVAWQAHFVKNMFIRPSEEDLKTFKPDFIMLNACKTTYPDFKAEGMNSEVFVAFHLGLKRAVIGGTWYGGEMKTGLFSVMHDFLPLTGM
ncbi:MAG: phosphoenolpyruvate carboxykinase (ATP), partial [Bacteroidales bacterium]|nr:phosphoenolpyruvate carboxykinase (ATP) [Bacteroidales bacterium]